MRTFFIHAVDKQTGEGRSITISAENQADAMTQASAQGLYIQFISENAPSAAPLPMPSDFDAPAKSDHSDNMQWFGGMVCSKCGYSWQSRRRTPPARCPKCGSPLIDSVLTDTTNIKRALYVVIILLLIILVVVAVTNIQSTGNIFGVKR